MVDISRHSRIERIQALLPEMGIDACVLKGMDNIFYLTGFRGSEGSLLVTRGDVVLMVDFRYITHAHQVTSGILIEELRAKQDVLYQLCTRYRISKLGFDGAHVVYNTYRSWADILPGITLVPMGNAVEEIRSVKEPAEIARIIEAVDIASEALQDVLGLVRPGRTEKEIADELDYAMVKRGADGPSFETIVASGPRAALPHAVPGDKKLAEGEAVIIDYGAAASGYCSDETVTICLGDIPDTLAEIYTIVNDARMLGIENARAGIPVGQLDMIVRGYIDEKGHGDHFRHGVGHGVGIAVHEAPAINSIATGVLEEDMVITIEPGIYIPNIGGVRLEDMVLITGDGPRILTHFRKDMMKV